MRIRRRRLRDALVVVGCLVASPVALIGPVAEPTGWIRFAAAVVLLLLGSLLHFWSKGCLEQNQKLVTAGPYRFTRNPFYLANGLIDLGLCALIGRVQVAVPYVVLWWLAYRDTIRSEEERLAVLFPEAFERYVAAVPRLIPTGRALPRDEAVGDFTTANPALAEGSEYARILGVWIAAATIVSWSWIRGQGLGVFDAEQTAGLGWVTLVPVAWVVKLAMAEVFRRPQTSLLPHADAPARRRLVTVALVVGFYVAARAFGQPANGSSPIDGAPANAIANIAFVSMIAAIALLPRAKSSARGRAWLHAGLAAAIVAYGIGRGVLWIAAPSLVWASLASMDDVAVARRSGASRVDEASSGERRLWPAFPAVAAGVVTSLALVAFARRMT